MCQIFRKLSSCFTKCDLGYSIYRIRSYLSTICCHGSSKYLQRFFCQIHCRRHLKPFILDLRTSQPTQQFSDRSQQISVRKREHFPSILTTTHSFDLVDYNHWPILFLCCSFFPFKHFKSV